MSMLKTAMWRRPDLMFDYDALTKRMAGEWYALRTTRREGKTMRHKFDAYIGIDCSGKPKPTPVLNSVALPATDRVKITLADLQRLMRTAKKQGAPATAELYLRRNDFDGTSRLQIEWPTA
jgi:hypothetical protein